VGRWGRWSIRLHHFAGGSVKAVVRGCINYAPAHIVRNGKLIYVRLHNRYTAL